MPRRSGGGGRSGGGFSRSSSGGMFSRGSTRSSPFRSSSPPRAAPYQASRSGATAAAPNRQPFTSPAQGQSRMGMPGMGSALGMGMALGAGSAIGHTAMNSMLGGGGRGGGDYGGGYDGGMSAPPIGAGSMDQAQAPYGQSLVDYATSQDMQLTPEQLNQKQLEQQAATDPCFSNVSTMLNCLKDNSTNIGLCQMQMDEMVACQKTHQPKENAMTNTSNTNSFRKTL
eukprot:403335021